MGILEIIVAISVTGLVIVGTAMVFQFESEEDVSQRLETFKGGADKAESGKQVAGGPGHEQQP
ncbi:MAG: hypothetical protein D6E12_15140 [Desulfovibrio sp.]|nr:MAG: hypothetical protein D6E12_15140 [Desulfovibrio sp.]